MDRRTVLLASLTGIAPWSTRAETTKQTEKPNLALNSANEVGNPTTIRAAIALRSAVQSVIWIGVEAGIFDSQLIASRRKVG